jgi:DNA-binding transcriptional LysR family regulator
MLDYRAEVFIHVARCLNISQAARDLYISQPAVTTAIQKLEEYYAVKLFLRKSWGLELTPAGVLLYCHLKELKKVSISLENEMMKLKGTLHGKLSIGAAPTFGNYILPRLLGLFSKSHPEVSYSLHIGNNDQIYAYLKEGRIELAFLVGTLPGKRLASRKVMDDELILVVSPHHPWSARDAVNGNELPAQPLILRERGSGSRKDMEEAFAEMGLSPEELNVIADFNSFEAIKQAVHANLGAALISRLAVKGELEQGLLNCIRIEGADLSRDIYAATLPDARLTEAASCLLQIVYKELADFHLD